MKKTFLLLIWLLPLTLLAQRVLTTDSTWIANANGLFYEHRLLEYSSGESTKSVTLLGDTSSVVNKYIDDLRRRTDAMATDVQVTSDFARQVREIVRQDGPIATLLGISPLNRLVAPVGAALVDSTYRVRFNGATKTFRFSLTNQGALRYRADTFPARPANYLGRVLRLNNWLNSGDPLDLYQFSNGRWHNSVRTVQVFLQSAGPQNRSASSAPEPDIAGLREPLTAPVLYEGGFAFLDGQWYKFNPKQRAWAKATAPAKPKPAKL